MMTALDLTQARTSPSAKPRMLVVDDEPDNLDLLYRTFRRDFSVLKAASGREALDVLSAEGEVAVIISDQRMPEMKGTEFLSKTVPQFPDTVRIILTGFTDVEDLVEAINAGQVYRYITKPWDPDELKQVVHRAAETYELLKQRTAELNQANAQAALLERLTEVAQTADSLQAALSPLAEVFQTGFAASHCCLRLTQGEALMGQSPASLPAELTDEALGAATEPRFVDAIAAPETDPALAALQPLGIQAAALLPIQWRQQIRGMLCLYWQTPQSFTDTRRTALTLATKQLALALTAFNS